jgi:hypothetical protein
MVTADVRAAGSRVPAAAYATITTVECHPLAPFQEWFGARLRLDCPEVVGRDGGDDGQHEVGVDPVEVGVGRAVGREAGDLEIGGG